MCQSGDSVQNSDVKDTEKCDKVDVMRNWTFACVAGTSAPTDSDGVGVVGIDYTSCPSCLNFHGYVSILLRTWFVDMPSTRSM